MRARHVAALLVLSGCDLAFPLEHVDGDRDGDGVGDSIDNCPDLPNDQHDEDGDGIGDRCDNCPHVPDTNGPGTNEDGDDLGDQCDTGPEIDCIVMFDTFANADNWAIDLGVGTWSIEDDSMVQSDPNQADGVLPTIATFDNVSVEVQAKIVTLGGSMDRAVGVWSPLVGTARQGLRVDLRARTADPKADLVITSVGSNGSTNIQDETFVVPNRNLDLGDVGVRLDDRDPDLAAHAEIGPNTANLPEPGTTIPFVAQPGPIALRTQNMAARFDYLLVVKHSTSACPPR